MNKQRSTICIKKIGNSTCLWNPNKQLHEMRLDEDNPHVEFLDGILGCVYEQKDHPLYGDLKRGWVESRFYRELEGGIPVTYDLKMKIKKNKVLIKDLYTMYLTEEEKKEELDFQKKHVTIFKRLKV